MPAFSWRVFDKSGQPLQSVDQTSKSLLEPDFYSPEGCLEASSMEEAKIIFAKKVAELQPSWSDEYDPERTEWTSI